MAAFRLTPRSPFGKLTSVLITPRQTVPRPSSKRGFFVPNILPSFTIAVDGKGLSENSSSGCRLIKYPQGEYACCLATVISTRSFLRFAAPNNHLRQRYIMSAIVSLSRPGLCAGCVPLHLLISKLLRSGEHLAACALQSLPECRVRWTLYGTSLTVEVA